MTKITTIGLDLAKKFFHVMCCDAQGKVVMNRMLKRGEVLAFFANLERCLIGMEACVSVVSRCEPVYAIKSGGLSVSTVWYVPKAWRPYDVKYPSGWKRARMG